MKPTLHLALCAATLAGVFSVSCAYAQRSRESNDKPISAPVIIHATAHTAHFNDFQIRRSKDRSLELQVKQKGLDLAFTEWMQKDHPSVFKQECVKELGEIAHSFQGTSHMTDFEILLPERADLRAAAHRDGHDNAFADWLRRERPDVYREHFGLGPDNKPLRQSNKAHKSTDGQKTH